MKLIDRLKDTSDIDRTFSRIMWLYVIMAILSIGTLAGFVWLIIWAVKTITEAIS